MAYTRWTFLTWPAAGLIGLASMIAVGLLLSPRPTLQVQSVQIRLAIALGVVAVMVFKLYLLSSLMILAAATALGIGVALIARGDPHRASSKLSSGSLFPQHELETISGEHIRVPDNAHLVHLQFRRFAGCPLCNLHLRSIVRRHPEITGAGIREVVVFHSSREELLEQGADVPFAVVADPHKELYLEFGVEASPRALLDPRVWLPIMVGVARSALHILQNKGRPPKLMPTGGRLGLPADFLIGADGRLLAVKYGAHAYDQWSVDELLGLGQHETRTVQLGVAPQRVRSAT